MRDCDGQIRRSDGGTGKTGLRQYATLARKQEYGAMPLYFKPHRAVKHGLAIFKVLT